MLSALTAEQLRQWLDYDPSTGAFRWKVQRGRVSVGETAGHLQAKSGYVSIKVDAHLYRAHRLAWLHAYGDWPKLEIDHINGKKSDNRLSNLRQATKAQNHANSKLQKNNKCGLKGVSWHAATQKWRAEVQFEGKRVHLGLFDRPELAHQKYLEGSAKLHGEFARAA